MTLEWKDGGSEPFKWATDGQGTWCAVWALNDRFIAWVLPRHPGKRQMSEHPTEAGAMDWCEIKMREETNNAD